MAWPDDMNFINSNLSTTELWVLKEQMDHCDWESDNFSCFAEYSQWEVTLNKVVYKFSEFGEVISEIYRL